MAEKYRVPLSNLIKEHQLEVLYMPKNAEDIYIVTPDINRPGLIFTGFDTFFDSRRINFLGITEVEFLKSFPQNIREERVKNFLARYPTCILLTRSLECPREIINYAPEYGVPVLRTSETTSRAMAAVIAYLNNELAERITRHGVFVEVYGEGVLILGDSGVGKSETAVELIKRGHRLIADDAVEIKKTGAKTLVGSAPDNIRHFVELRGIGIINASRIFGIGSVKLAKDIDMVIRLENWDTGKSYDRVGGTGELIDILGVRLPYTVVPVKPGRNLAIICESAAVNYRQKKMGYNAAQEFYKRIQENFAKKREEDENNG